MEPCISIITLGVADLERSTAFYQEGLGLPCDRSFEGIRFFHLQGTWLSLYPREALAADAQVPAAGSGFRGFTLAHNVASKAAVDQLLAQAAAVGGKILKPAQDADWGGYSGYFEDLDGFLWEIAWNPNFDLTK
ncbi:MAG: VOC family protein [Microcoleus sp. SIO2G3]|nr:VOC family protein [Microcoleus sp. SIO2G3]